MIEVVIYNLDAWQVSHIVQSLKDQGFVIGVDFDYAYVPTQHMGFDAPTPKHTRFMWHNESAGSWFALKYR